MLYKLFYVISFSRVLQRSPYVGYTAYKHAQQTHSDILTNCTIK